MQENSEYTLFYSIKESRCEVKLKKDQVVGYFAVIPLQTSFFVAGKDRRVHAAQQKLVFFV